MNRTLLFFLTFVSLIFVNVYGQETGSENVDIRAILDKQISEIRKLQETNAGIVNTDERPESKTDIIPVDTKQQTEIMPDANEKVNKQIEEFLPKDIAVKLFIIIEIVMFAGLVLMWLNKNKKNKKRQISILKRNIKNLREEKIGSRFENNLSRLRNSLRFDPIKINDNGKDITFRARKNQISKGEIHLAAKIKLLRGEYR